jgi:ATP-dependent 26S proteasome regulatory subunit
MSIVRKSILYNGFEIHLGAKTVNRTAFEFSTDVYKLTDNRFLILRATLSHQDTRNSDPEIIEVFVGRTKYHAIIVEKYSKLLLARMMSDMVAMTGFDAVAGMQDPKEVLINDVITPLKHLEKYKRFKLSIPNGILLFGPPGCGKTFIVRKLEVEIGFKFVEIKHSDVGSPYIH